MTEIAFVDHSYHLKTNSSEFFKSILKKRFSVKSYYFTPKDKPDFELIEEVSRADIIVIWQMDFMAPIFLGYGKPTIVVPMYDGSANMPDLHWMFSANARYINFSLMLHERTRQLGLNSLLVKYFPEPCLFQDRATFDDMRAFLWQRAPASGINAHFVIDLLGTTIDRLHIHNAPDESRADFYPVPRTTPLSVTESRWFASKVDYDNVLRQSNIYIAPRISEGIGMAFLEGMAKGMLVVASDVPTHNEYIANYINGILFDPYKKTSSINVRGDAARIGLTAWNTVAFGYERWLDQQDQILDWIEATPSKQALSNIDYQRFSEDLFTEYYDSLESYRSFLFRSLAKISRISGISHDILLETVGVAIKSEIGVGAPPRFGTVKSDGIMDITSAEDSFTSGGWSVGEGTHRWIEGTRANLTFRFDFDATSEIAVEFSAQSLPGLGKNLNVYFEINGSAIGVIPVQPRLTNYSIRFSGELLRSFNTISIIAERCGYAKGDNRILSVAFSEFRFICL